MFADLDESMRQLLIREVPLNPTDVDIVFDRPDRDNVARFTKPTVNLFLFDVIEDAYLRESGWGLTRNGNGIATLRWPPLRVDVRYLVTVWAQAVDDEHRLLYHLYRTFRRMAEVPVEAREGLIQNQTKPLRLLVEDTELKTVLDLWGVLDNRMQPSFIVRSTVAIDLNAVRQEPVVRTMASRIGLPPYPPETTQRVFGKVRDSKGKAVAGARVRSGRRTATTDAEGLYSLQLAAETVDIKVTAAGFGDETRTVSAGSDFDFTLSPADAPPEPAPGARGRGRRGGG
jgi:hypothetical protein